MPSVRNHTSVTGPNTEDTLPVPKRCTMNRVTLIAAVIGTT